MRRKAGKLSIPELLPAGYHEIWNFLHKEDTRVSSRQVLARSLHVSTHTLQRILVTGNVPVFKNNTSARITNSWVKTITKIADYFGIDPQIWVESIGIKWTSGIQAIVEASLSGSRDSTDIPVKGFKTVYAAETHEQSDLYNLFPDQPHIGIVDYEPFSLTLPGFGKSFLEVFSRRLVGAAFPGKRPIVYKLTPPQLAEELSRRNSYLHIGTGILENMKRRTLGIRFLPIPGLLIRLAAIVIRPEHDNRVLPSFSEVISGRDNRCFFFVPQNSISGDFLRGQCGLSSDNLLIRYIPEDKKLPGLFFSETCKRPDNFIILTADEITCRATINALNCLDGFSEKYTVQMLDGSPEECPSYSLSIGVRQEYSTLMEILERTVENELFGNSCRLTAQLYAELISVWLFRSVLDDPENPSNLRSFFNPIIFRASTIEFQEILRENLEGLLRKGIISRLSGKGKSIVLPDSIDSIASEMASKHALLALSNPYGVLSSPGESVLPSSSALQDSGEKSYPDTEHQKPQLCRSCMANLREKHNRGKSDIYCCYCSDSDGNLLPRKEVHMILSRWLMALEDLSIEEAKRRAKFYMKAMPAWNN